MAAGNIDDTMFAVSSPTVKENVEKLEKMTPELLTWSCTHSCRFNLDKFQLVHFSRTVQTTPNRHQWSPHLCGRQR